MQNGTHGLVSVVDPDFLAASEDLPVLQKVQMPLPARNPVQVVSYLLLDEVYPKIYSLL